MTAEFSSLAHRVPNLEQRSVLMAAAIQHGAAEVQAHTGVVQAWFEDEDTCNRFDAEADAYLEQQEFLDSLSEEEQAELGLQL